MPAPLSRTPAKTTASASAHADSPAKAWYDDQGVFRPQLALRPSRWFAALQLAIAALAALLAAVSVLPWPWKGALLASIWALLWQCWRQERRRGLRELVADPEDTQALTLRFADGSVINTRYRGYAVLGTLAIFVFVERRGWKKLPGSERFTILCDATSAEDFRRLRAWTRLS